MRRTHRVLPLVCLFISASSVKADDPLPYETSAPAVIEEFNIEKDGSNFLIIPVKIAGATFGGMIDTGSTYSIVDSSLRRFVGKAIDRLKVDTPAGSANFQFFKGPEIEFGQRPVKIDLEKVGCIDLAPFRQLSKREFHIVIGMDVLKRFAIKLDFPNAIGTILDEPAVGSSRPISLSFSGGAPWIFGRLWKADIWFLIDTGSVGIGEGNLSRDVFEYLRRRGSVTVAGNARYLSVRGEKTRRTGRLHALVVGNLLYTASKFCEANGCSLALGHLSRHVVTLDFPNHVAYFDLPAQVQRDGPLASLGLVTAWKGEKLFVTSADPKGRAAQSDVRAGDHVVAVDGVAFRKDAQPAPARPSTDRDVVLSINRGRALYTMTVSPTGIAATSVKVASNSAASRPGNPVRTASSSTSSTGRRWRNRRR
jgi:hypothetical protein